MAVEKMEILDIVGHMDNVDDIARRIVLSSAVHMVNAITEVQQSNFPILQAQGDVDAVLDYSYIRQYSSEKDFDDIEMKLKVLMETMEIKKKVTPQYYREEYNFSKDLERINKGYDLINQKYEEINKLYNEIDELKRLEENIGHFKYIDVNFNDLLDMKYIKMKLGCLPKYNMDKLKKNYENISAIVIKLYQDPKEVFVMVFVPRSVEIEVDRVLVSLNFEEYRTNFTFNGSPTDWVESSIRRRDEITQRIEGIRAEISDFKEEYYQDVEKYYSRLQMEYKIEELKSYIVCTNEFFYLTGWVPLSKKQDIIDNLSKYDDRLIIVSKDAEDTREGLEPPTCLKNNFLTKPFESVIRLYGTPSYNEIDPTTFLGITYMLLFGAMFGDVGQGAVLFTIGIILKYLGHRPNLGGVFSRLGVSSMFFGFLYGSLFGFENILHAILVKPMESINDVLIGAIGFGVILLSFGYIFNLINSYRRKDIESGLFSSNGLAGLFFFWILMYLVIGMATGIGTVLPPIVLVMLLVLMLILMLLKEPLANLIKGVRPLYHESKADYYVEGGFGIIETLLSIFSNTISFIRVGAFAINHVGLFIAFEAMAGMMGNSIGSALIIILGNIVIIGLEGLIVFIQGLRLEYYELFSKYFEGAGYEYKPLRMKLYSNEVLN